MNTPYELHNAISESVLFLNVSYYKLHCVMYQKQRENNSTIIRIKVFWLGSNANHRPIKIATLDNIS